MRVLSEWRSTIAGDRHISYLPLAHIYERVQHVGFIQAGVQIGFYRRALLDSCTACANLHGRVLTVIRDCMIAEVEHMNAWRTQPSGWNAHPLCGLCRNYYCHDVWMLLAVILLI